MSGGTYIGMTKKHNKIYTVDADAHTLCIGATGSGKTRCNSLPTICTLALNGESMIISDPKSELYLYTYPFLKERGYEVITIDFKNPRRSAQYNFLQPVIDAVNMGDIGLAITKTRDIVSMIAQSDSYSERIWTDGERAVMASAILAVVYDNRTQPEYQNLTNVYHFLGKMCCESGKSPPLIEEYMNRAGDTHPAVASLDIAKIAPEKMRGSFYTSALVSLELFATPDMYDLTCQTGFDIYSTGKRKRAIFIILPDSKDTFYKFASLFVYQHYQTLVEQCEKSGNRIPVRVNFVLDEFGNFTKIPNFDKHITVGRSRGIKYSLYLQDLNQLDNVYGDKVGRIIRANCDIWIYLSGNSQETAREISDRLGNYTIKSPSASHSKGGLSSSFSYTSRNLLTPEEVKKIQRPYQLVMSKGNPAIMYAPDISKTPFNRMLGMGSKSFNIELIMQREKELKLRKTVQPEDIRLWKIWEQCREEKIKEQQFKQQQDNDYQFRDYPVY